jgi:AraC-like DNA-binding protein
MDMVGIYSKLLISTGVLGCYVSIVLVFIARQNRLLNRLLGAFTLFQALFFLLIYSIVVNHSPDFLLLVRTFVPFYYIVPPLGYLYFRSFILDENRLRHKDWLHFLPLGLHLIYISPLIGQISTGKISWAEILTQVNTRTYFYNTGPFPDAVHALFRLTLMYLYVSLIWKLYLSRNYRLFTQNNRAIYPSGIRWSLLFSITTSAQAFFATFVKISTIFYHQAPLVNDINANTVFMLLSFDCLLLYVVFNQEILFGMPNFKKNRIDHQDKATTVSAAGQTAEPAATQIALSVPHEPEETETTGTRPELADARVADEQEAANEKSEKAAIQDLTERMEVFVRTQQPFRNQEFNIASLSNDLDVPQHHIAFIFKNILQKSFVDYRNELRVAYIIEKLKQGKYKDITLEAIGADAGFNSRTTFCVTFKKITGKTPKQYVQDR